MCVCLSFPSFVPLQFVTLDLNFKQAVHLGNLSCVVATPNLGVFLAADFEFLVSILHSSRSLHDSCARCCCLRCVVAVVNFFFYDCCTHLLLLPVVVVVFSVLSADGTGVVLPSKPRGSCRQAGRHCAVRCDCPPRSPAPRCRLAGLHPSVAERA